MKPLFRALLFALTIAPTFCVSAQTTIIERSGTPANGTSIGPDQTLAVSWIQSDPFANVAINATLGGSGQFTAYLTTQLGPGTTVANEIASTTLPFPSDYISLSIFSGLSLPAGTYYLVVASDNNGSWGQDFSSTTTTASGVSYNHGYVAFTRAPYPPASSYSTLNDSTGLLFKVSGTLVPEPSTLAMFGIGAAGLAVILRRRR